MKKENRRAAEGKGGGKKGRLKSDKKQEWEIGFTASQYQPTNAS